MDLYLYMTEDYQEIENARKIKQIIAIMKLDINSRNKGASLNFGNSSPFFMARRRMK